MEVVLTSAGQALLEANEGPVTVTSYELGSAFGYTPQPSDTNIHGTLIYTGVPSAPLVADANVVKYSMYLDYTLGPFTFGEVGLFVGSTLFALATGNTSVTKTPVSGNNIGNAIRIDMYLSIVESNYEMWLNLNTSNSQFQMAVLASVDQLPQSANAVPNAYIISGASGTQSAYLAYTDKNGLWNFDVYAYANQATVTVQSSTAQSVTIPLSQYLQGFDPGYFGEVIAEFSSGTNYSLCRYVQSVVLTGSTATLNFYSMMLTQPAAGDTIVIFGRQQLSTTIANLPIATTSTLGAIIVGTTLTVSGTGLLNVAPGSYPVTSVNDLTGDVVLNNTNISGFAAVAYSGNYSDLNGAPPAYTLPIATTTVLGGVKAPTGDSNITIAGDGTIDLGFAPVKTVNGASPDGTGNVTVTAPTVVGLVTPTKILNGTDLDSIQTTGLYFVLDADASSIGNFPVASSTTGGTLDVEPFTTTASGGDVIQRLSMAAGLYIRRYTQSTNTWGAWTTFATSTAIPIATTSTLGGVIVGSGLSVTGLGVLSANLTSINGLTGAPTLTASDVGAIATSLINNQGGVAGLDQNTGTANPATDPYTYGRMYFYENTLGTLQYAGQWNASTNHVSQVHSSLGFDTNTALAASGQHTIDISYDGNGRSGLAVPDYQTVDATGMVYLVTTAGTTSIDGISVWNIGDYAISLGGAWQKIISDAPAGSTAYVRENNAWVALTSALPVASASTEGIMQVGSGLSVTSGTVSVAGTTTNSLTGPTSWYRSNSDGTVEIGGQYVMGSGTTTATVTLPISISLYISGSVCDIGSSCYYGSVTSNNSTSITLYAPAYWVDASGTISARGSFTMQWSILAKP